MGSYIAGIDEAGRGPVIGPLVICCAICKRVDEKRLKKLASRDSKGMTPKAREETYQELKKFVTFRWHEVSAHELNLMMAKMSLNDIEARSMAELIKKFGEGDVMIDMPDRYSWTFRGRMQRFGVTRFEAEHKADDKYPIVSAASICAKVLRDGKIDEIKRATCDFGSGYPGDKKTMEALRDKEKRKMLQPFVRTRWKTIEDLSQTKLFEGEDD